LLDWSTLFTGTGADLYTQVSGVHPHVYQEAVAYTGVYDMWIDMIKGIPNDIWTLWAIFILSIVPLTLVVSIFFIFIMPILKRPQRW
jgi:hypothetical protein